MLGWIGVFGLAAVIAACGGDGDPPAAPVQVRLLAFNDFHGNLEPTNLALTLPDPTNPAQTVRVNTGGAAYLASKLAALRAEKTHSLTISSGDLIGASPLVSAFFRDEPTLEAMNAMKVDINAVGNHEFDKGVSELKRIVAGGCNGDTSDPNLSSCVGPTTPYPGARFTFLAGNVVDGSNQPLFPAYTVREFAGAKIGVIGVVTRTTPTIVVPSGVAGMRFLDEAETINKAADELEARGVKAIVAVVHEGGQTDSTWNDDTCANARGEIFAIADKLRPSVDVIFSGHTHQGYRCVRNGVPILQAFAFGRGISQVDVTIDPATRDIDRTKTVWINVPVVNDTNAADVAAKFPPVTADAAVKKIVDDYAALAAPKANRKIGVISEAITRAATAGGADSAAGRLIADSQLAATAPADKGAAQIAFMNPGGIRADFACASGPCDLSFGAAFTVQPFGNSLVVMTLTGAQIKDLLEQQATGANAGRPRILQPSVGFTYTWTVGNADGQRTSALKLNGADIVPTQDYRVTVNSFLADGGDGFTLLRSGTNRLGGLQDIDALIAYFAANSPVAPTTTPRVQVP